MSRLFDICLASIGLIVLSPIILILFILVRIKLGSPILFKQKRPGKDNKLFIVYKFRTMNNKVNNLGELSPDEERLTPFGMFLRKYSLDELPQLYNVLIGDLALVGPRPLLIDYLPLYTPEQARRHTVRPGITGWAQINGRNNLSWEEKFNLDIWYVDNKSFLLDLKIILLTIKKVFKASDINQAGQATMEKFRGSV